jgi:hypothetical protein
MKDQDRGENENKKTFEAALTAGPNRLTAHIEMSSMQERGTPPVAGSWTGIPKLLHRVWTQTRIAQR